jgi:AcrR family transcriptional regulator
MRARQESVDETRLRITQATVALHERVGPRHTTVSAIADAAGVTRLTVYRHFPDDSALVAACSQHWSSLHPGPDVSGWYDIADPVFRLRRALLETYRWARDAAPMMTKIRRDLDVMPAFVAEFLADDDRARVAALAQPFRVRGAAHRRLTSAIAHALDIRTWESLCLRGQLEDSEAVQAMVAAVTSVLNPASQPRGAMKVRKVALPGVSSAQSTATSNTAMPEVG